MKINEWTEQETLKLKELCEAKKYTFKEISEILDRSIGATAMRASSMGFKNNWMLQPKYTYNRNYFKEITLDNCYWAGILTTDGHINYNGGAPNIVWGCAIKDIEHIKLFLKNIESNHPIKIVWKKCNLSTVDKEKEFENARLAIYSCREWAKDLERNFGFTPDKTLRFPPPTLPSLKHELAFIKGMIDGDGTITQNNSEGSANINIVSCNRDILIWIKKVVDFINLPTLANKRIAKVCQDQNKTYIYALNGLKSMVFLELMSRINTPFLSRKWQSDSVLQNLNYWKSRPEWPNEEFFANVLNKEAAGPDITKEREIYPVKNKSWTQEEDDLIRRLAATKQYSFKMMAEQFLKDRTQVTVMKRAQILGISNDYSSRRKIPVIS